MSSIYCGIGEPNSKQRAGTMKECAEKNQIRMYGLKLVDQLLIDHFKNKKKGDKATAGTQEELFGRIGLLQAKIRKLKKQQAESDNRMKKAEIKLHIEVAAEELEEVREKIKELSGKTITRKKKKVVKEEPVKPKKKVTKAEPVVKHKVTKAEPVVKAKKRVVKETPVAKKRVTKEEPAKSKKRVCK